MVTGQYESPVLDIWKSYEKFEQLSKATKWYQYIKRWQIRNQVLNIQRDAISVGIYRALKDLQENGLS